MIWIIVISGLVIFFLWANRKRVEDYTYHPDALPCIVCGTASAPKTLGYYVCPKCNSRWLPWGAKVIKFSCGHCKAKPIKIIQDTHDKTLFEFWFACGRRGNYSNANGSKWDRIPCPVEVENIPVKSWNAPPKKKKKESQPIQQSDSAPDMMEHGPLPEDYFEYEDYECEVNRSV